MFQAVVFNLFLYTFTLAAKYEEKTGNAQWIEFTEQEYSKLKLNETEFTYNDNLYDIITSKREGGTIKLLCKIDAKEKDFLEKLIEGFKQNKTKKLISFSFVGEMNTPDEFISYIYNDSKAKHICFKSSVLESSLERTIPPPKV
jgi:PDZ domain-containing secreted protein